MLFPMVLVEQVITASDIVAMVRDAGMSLTWRGRRFEGICPFHCPPTKQRTFLVWRPRHRPLCQRFYCIGCGVGGDVWRLAELLYHADQGQALLRLAQRAGICIPAEAKVAVER